METHEFFFCQTKLRKNLTKFSVLGKSMAVKKFVQGQLSRNFTLRIVTPLTGTS